MPRSRKNVASAKSVRELVDLAFANRYQNVEMMLSLSSKAVVLAEEQRDALPEDLLAAAWTQYGNALRIMGRYPEAEKALARAASLANADELTRIHCLEVTASLHRSTGRLESAARLLRSAIEAYRSLGDADGEARTQNLLGIVYFDQRDLPQALEAYKTALDLVGPDTALEYYASSAHNLVEALIAEGRLQLAAWILDFLEPFHSRLTSSRLVAKAVWMRGRLYREQKQYGAAHGAFRQAYERLSTESSFPELADLAREIAELDELIKRKR